MEMHPEMDTSEWQVRHRHEIATRGRGMVTATDRQHNHDMRVLIDRLDLLRAQLAVTVTERDAAVTKLSELVGAADDAVQAIWGEIEVGHSA